MFHAMQLLAAASAVAPYKDRREERCLPMAALPMATPRGLASRAAGFYLTRFLLTLKARILYRGSSRTNEVVHQHRWAARATAQRSELLLVCARGQQRERGEDRDAEGGAAPAPMPEMHPPVGGIASCAERRHHPRDARGRKAIEKVMRNQPAVFLKLLVLLVPREMKVEHSRGGCASISFISSMPRSSCSSVISFEGLKVPHKQPQRGRLWLTDGSCIRLRPERRNHVWSYDFVEDRTHDGRKYRMLNVLDEFTHECLAGTGLDRVIDVLSDLFILRGIPAHIRSDNGPEFVAKADPCRPQAQGDLPRPPTSSGAAPGRMATSRASTPASAMSCSTARFSTLYARPRSSSRVGDATTTR